MGEVMWIVTGKIGLFWSGPKMNLGGYRWRWLAWLRAELWLMDYPYSTARIEYYANHGKGK
jgi:hypothetical protein